MALLSESIIVLWECLSVNDSEMFNLSPYFLRKRKDK